MTEVLSEDKACEVEVREVLSDDKASGVKVTKVLSKGQKGVVEDQSKDEAGRVGGYRRAQ